VCGIEGGASSHDCLLQTWLRSYSLRSCRRPFILFGAAPDAQRGRECSNRVSADDGDDDDAACDCDAFCDCDADCTWLVVGLGGVSGR
jgi:hypothetical protein